MTDNIGVAAILRLWHLSEAGCCRRRVRFMLAALLHRGWQRTGLHRVGPANLSEAGQGQLLGRQAHEQALTRP
jgi:hypothetical protein